MNIRSVLVSALLTIGGFAGATAQSQTLAENPTAPPPKPDRQAPAVEKNLKVFDTLDFDVFSNQKWDRLPESHAEDIVVKWPDGHETKGLLDHRHGRHDRHIYSADAVVGWQFNPAHRQALCDQHGDQWTCI